VLSHLYIVKSTGGLIKIGRSSCPKRRITEIAKATGTAVVKQFISPICLNAHTIERYLHKHFAEHRQQGEWFTVDFQTAVEEAKQQTFQTEEPSKLMPFEFDGNQIRTLTDENGEPWFVAKDVCKVVEISKYRDAIAKLDDDERVSMLVDTPGGKQKMVCVNEFGL
jgi:hypothetical protein